VLAHVNFFTCSGTDFGNQKRSIGERNEDMKKFGRLLMSIRLYQHVNKNPHSITMDEMYPDGGKPSLNRALFFGFLHSSFVTFLTK